MPGQREPRLLSLGIRLGINAAALWLAAEQVRGFEIDGWQSLLATAAIFGVINALIKPVAQFLSLPVSCLTLGLFALIVNAAMLALTVAIGDLVGLEVELDGFVAAFLAALLVSFASWLLNMLVGAPLRRALR